MNEHGSFGQPTGTGTTPMGGMYSDPLPHSSPTSSFGGGEHIHDTWLRDQREAAFYGPSEMSQQLGRGYGFRVNNGYDGYGGGAGGGGYVGHQGTAGEGIFALVLLIGILAVVVAAGIFVIKAVLSFINGVGR